MSTELVNRLFSVPQRENAGARSSNRFSYQQVWAFDYMIKNINSNKDFVLFMEFHDDIIILDKTCDDEYVEFYQIKTDNKDARYLTSSFIIKDYKKYPDKMSIAQKMIDGFVKFETDIKGIHLVSNKSFDFGTLKDTSESKIRNIVRLNELEDIQLKKIKDGMCEACHKYHNCTEECIDLIYFDVADLDLNSYEDTVLGRMIKKMDELEISSTIERTRCIYNTILGEIRRINNHEKEAQNINELIQKKSISKKDFLKWINKLKMEMPDELWNQIHLDLITDGFKPLEIRKIHKQWKKYQIDRMNIEALALEKLADRVQIIIEEQEFDNLRECLEYIYSKICEESIAKLYNKEYLYALILKEMFS